MSKYSKKLIVGGCSMVANYVHYRNIQSNYGKTNVPIATSDRETIGHSVKWDPIEPFPTIDVPIARHFGLQPMNTALPGASNQTIFRRLVQCILEYPTEIDTIVACWSAFNRIEVLSRYGDHLTVNAKSYRNAHRKEFNNDLIYEGWKLFDQMGRISIEIDIDQFFFYAQMLQQLCDYNNIKLYQCASISTIYDDEDDEKRANEYFYSHRGFDRIDHDKFYGWPLFYMLGGKTLFGDTIFRGSYRIAPNDPHPNEMSINEAAKSLIKFIENAKT